jgi:hypothetical protein
MHAGYRSYSEPIRLMPLVKILVEHGDAEALYGNVSQGIILAEKCEIL